MVTPAELWDMMQELQRLFSLCSCAVEPIIHAAFVLGGQSDSLGRSSSHIELMIVLLQAIFGNKTATLLANSAGQHY